MAREIRALGVYSEIHPHDITPEAAGGPAQCEGHDFERRPEPGGGRRGDRRGPGDLQCAGSLCCWQTTRGMQPWPAGGAGASERRCADFVFGVCGAEANWNMENFIADQVELIRRQVGDKKVLLALSGGVDSSVVAALLHQGHRQAAHLCPCEPRPAAQG